MNKSFETLSKIEFDSADDARGMRPKGFSDKVMWEPREGEETSYDGTLLVDGVRYIFTYRQNFLAERNDFMSFHVAVAPDGFGLGTTKARANWIEKNRYEHDEVFMYAGREDFSADVRVGHRYCKPCIACGAKLQTENADWNHTYQQPSGGTNFTSGGHYGSTVFDPMGGGETLSINVCDDCMKAAGQKGWVEHQQSVRVPREDNTIYTDWDYYSEYEDED